MYHAKHGCCWCVCVCISLYESDSSLFPLQFIRRRNNTKLKLDAKQFLFRNNIYGVSRLSGRWSHWHFNLYHLLRSMNEWMNGLLSFQAHCHLLAHIFNISVNLNLQNSTDEIQIKWYEFLLQNKMKENLLVNFCKSEKELRYKEWKFQGRKKKTLKHKFFSISLSKSFNAKNMNCVRYFLELLTCFRIKATNNGTSCIEWPIQEDDGDSARKWENRTIFALNNRDPTANESCKLLMKARLAHTMHWGLSIDS